MSHSSCSSEVTFRFGLRGSKILRGNVWIWPLWFATASFIRYRQAQAEELRKVRTRTNEVLRVNPEFRSGGCDGCNSCGEDICLFIDRDFRTPVVIDRHLGAVEMK